MADTIETHPKSRWHLSFLEWSLIALGLLAILACFLLPAIKQARAAARRTQSKNTLKQIGLALMGYESTFRTLPPGGVYNQQGVAFHSWTTALDPYTSASPWNSQVNFSVPWDDPTQIDHFLRSRNPIWTNPRVEEPPREDGLMVAHYAANSWLMYRNSSVTLDEIGDTGNTLLAAEARGHFVPIGCPGNWRDVDVGYNSSLDSFGCPGQTEALIALADGSVRGVDQNIEPDVWNALAGQPRLRPVLERREGMPWPYVLKEELRVRKRIIVTGHKQIFAMLVLSADGHTLQIRFLDTESQPRTRRLSEQVDELMEFGDIQNVQCTGKFDASELTDLWGIKNLKRLTLSTATVNGDLKKALVRLGPSMTID